VNPRRPQVALVLGGGAARGWAHVGAIRELAERGIAVDMVTGTSVGAIVGGALAAGVLDEFEDWINSLRRRDIVRLLDARIMGGGFLRGAVLTRALEKIIGNPDIAELGIPFSCVATELGTGREIWLRDGPLLAACRASISLPGLFAPARQNGYYLLDGGLVNPVPVSLARAMGAEIVIAVDLNGHLGGEYFWVRPREAARGKAEAEMVEKAPGEDSGNGNGGSMHPWAAKLTSSLGVDFGAYRASLQRRDEVPQPGLFDVIVGSIDIMQDRITRSRMAGEPPDIHISPRVGHIGLMDFDRAAECIPEGRRAVARKGDEIERLREILARSHIS